MDYLQDYYREQQYLEAERRDEVQRLMRDDAHSNVGLDWRTREPRREAA